LQEGVVALPSMMALGATRDADLAERAGAQLGSDLAGLGVNVDFAPVLDLALESRNTVIGTRAFASDPAPAGELGSAFARGLSKSVVAVGKHFPGHGATDVDSHYGLPILNVDLETWRERDLVPFRRAVEGGIPALMSAHVILPALDRERPTTLSPSVITGVLREACGFDGVVFTDCLEMGAIAEHFGSVEAAPHALAAGCDCVLFSSRLELAEAAIEKIARAVEEGMLPETRLREAAARVRRLRSHVAARAASAADDVGREIARRAVTLLRGSLTLAPDAPVTVISFESGERPSLAAVLRARGRKSELMRVPLEPADDDGAVLEMVVRALGEREIVILARRAHLYPAQAGAIARLLTTGATPDARVVSAREPFDAEVLTKARNLACIYGDDRISLEGLADVLNGQPAVGTLPVRLDAAAAIL
ncbi:MAG: glycoside hydrolase family 3 protein, partial [Candidatus Eremiobacteraeota bacterium]|nr:glycoside hydrolase family 3 protein [Candidatus Eremiobacteraeota bacterium]